MLEANDRAKCSHCKKTKFDIFKILSGKYVCSDCIEKLGGRDFLNAYIELEKELERKNDYN